MTATDFDIWNVLTPEFIASMPEAERASWQQVYDMHQEGLRLIAEYASERRFGKALGLVDSKQRAAAMIDWDEIYSFTDEEVDDLIANYWSITEAWSGDERLREGMMGLLRRVAPFGIEALPAKPRFLTVYRGNLGEKPGAGSWTLDRATAQHFAEMANGLRGEFLGMKCEGGVPTVWQALVAREKILGYFDDRDEQEVVIESGLTEVHRVAVARPQRKEG